MRCQWKKKFELLGYVIVILFVGCSNGFDKVATDFSDSVSNATGISYTVEDEGFEPKGMLSDLYLVASDMTLCLFAPQASTYEWQIYKIKVEVLDEMFGITETVFEPLDIPGYIPLYSKQLYVYIPDIAELLPTGTYKLELKVTNKNGDVFTDASALVIYDPFYGIN